MSTYIYIILFLSIFLAFNCAPSKHFRNKNMTNDRVQSNDLFFNWPSADENRDDYEDSNGIEYDNTTESDNEYNSRTKKISRNNYNNKKYIDENKSRKTGKNNDLDQRIHNEITRQKYADRSAGETGIMRYKVNKGDTLFKVSEKYNVPIIEIIKSNNIKNDDKISEGMIIRIPVKRITTESKKENLYKNSAQAPPFIWPMKNIYNTKRDEFDGVKPIGIIITGKPGNYVLSSADGIIEKIGYMRGFGHYIIVKHVNKYLTIYSNLKEIDVTEGCRIRSGQALGRIDGNKLHFQIGHSGKPEDPLIYLSKRN